MKLDDINNLDFSNIGGWPGPVKAVAIVLLCGAVLAAGYWFDTKNQIASLEQAEAKENELKNIFEAKQRQAANLEPLKQQLREMKESFGALLRLLPNKTEIEALLVDISQSGLAAGLEFELFKPGPEQLQEFYAIQPIQIRVTGTYHEFGEFVSSVAALPRIVTQHDVTITPAKQSDSSTPQLVMTMVAKTYRYLEEDEIQAAQTK